MKKYFLLPIALLFGFIFFSCSDDSTNPETTTTGSVYLVTVPTGAQIWLNGVNKSKVTPDSLTGLDAGTYQVTYKLTGYRDTTISVTVVGGQKTVAQPVLLTSTKSTTTFGPVRIYETVGTTAAQPSGLQLSSGNAYGTSGADKAKVDIYYSSDGYLVRSSDYTGLTRVTYFKVGAASDLTDGVSSSTKDNLWTKSMSDRESKYVFLYDNDKHYSKIIITGYGGGTPGNPAYVEVKWIYNKTADDIRF